MIWQDVRFVHIDLEERHLLSRCAAGIRAAASFQVLSEQKKKPGSVYHYTVG
jgi:hypothetical protein